jgi:hypothetical protein
MSSLRQPGPRAVPVSRQIPNTVSKKTLSLFDQGTFIQALVVALALSNSSQTLHYRDIFQSSQTSHLISTSETPVTKLLNPSPCASC